MRECDYCHGTGEVPESSIRYMACPKCKGKCMLEDQARPPIAPPIAAPEPPRQASLFGTVNDASAFDPK